VDPPPVSSASQLVAELVDGGVERGERVCGNACGAPYRSPCVIRQLDMDPARGLARIALLGYLDVNPIRLAVEPGESIQLVLHIGAKPFADRGVA
jgi:hypothetical protein